MKNSLARIGLFCSVVLFSLPAIGARFDVKILQTLIYSGDSSDLDQYEVHLLPDGRPIYFIKSRFQGYAGINQEFIRSQKEVQVSESFQNELPSDLNSFQRSVVKDDVFQLETSRLFLDHRFNLGSAAANVEEIRFRLEKENAKLQEQINANALRIKSLKETTIRFKMMQSERDLRSVELQAPTTKTNRPYGIGRSRSKL